MLKCSRGARSSSALGVAPLGRDGGEVGERRRGSPAPAAAVGRAATSASAAGPSAASTSKPSTNASQRRRPSGRRRAASRRAPPSSIRAPAGAASSPSSPPARSGTAARRRRPARCGRRRRRGPARRSGAGTAISIFIASTTPSRSPAVDDVAGRDVDADDERGGRGPHDAGVVAGEAVGDAVDLDEVVAALHRRHDGERRVRRSPAGSARGRAARRRRRRRRRRARPAKRSGAELAHGDLGRTGRRGAARRSRPIAASACGRPRLGPARGTPPRSARREQRRRRRARRRRGRRRAMPRRQVLVGRGQPVEPRRVDVAGAHLGPLEQVEQERLVRRAAVARRPSSATAPGGAGPAPRRGRDRGR